jgi:hypothetical protein
LKVQVFGIAHQIGATDSIHLLKAGQARQQQERLAAVAAAA